MPSGGLLPLPANPQEDSSWKVRVATIFGLIIPTLAVLLRLVARWLCAKGLELNDFLIMVAYLPKLGLTLAGMYLIQHGIGRHIHTVPLDQLVHYYKNVYVGSFLYIPCVALTKLSLLSLYWTTFKKAYYLKISVIVASSIVILWAIACMIVGMLQCLPIHKAWDTGVPGHCIDLDAFYYGLQIPNIVTDIAILVMPFKAISDLKLERKTNLQLTAVMALGIVTAIFDIIRLVVLLHLQDHDDPTWQQVGAAIWTDLEASMAMLTACLPVMPSILSPVYYYRESRKPAKPEGGNGNADQSVDSSNIELDKIDEDVSSI